MQNDSHLANAERMEYVYENECFVDEMMAMEFNVAVRKPKTKRFSIECYWTFY